MFCECRVGVAVSLPTSLCAVGGLEEVDRSLPLTRQLMLCQTGTAGSTRASHGGNGGRWSPGLLSTACSPGSVWRRGSGACATRHTAAITRRADRVPAGNDPPGSEGQFQLINLAAVVVLAVAAVLPVAMLPLWARRGSRLVLLALCWVVAVGCCMHALIDMAQRVLSLAGLVHIHYPPLWATINDRAADLQDLFGNEPWFLLEGLAFGALGWIALGPAGRGGGGRSAPWPRPAR